MGKTRIRIIICLLILSILSLSALFSALHQSGRMENEAIFYRQIAWITIGWLFLFAFSFVNYRLYFDLAFFLYIFNIALLIGVKLFGREIMGAKRWIPVFGINFQPSEFSKLVIIILLARFFSQDKETRGIFLRKMLVPLGLVLITFSIIFKQPDLGTALICLLLFFLLGLSSRLKKWYFIMPLALVVVASPLAWHVLKDYQKKRLLVFLNPATEPLGAGYTIIQSKIAIGSGKSLGKGFLSGTQNQFNFLPERHTDFIFTVIAEEWGFMGSLFLLLVYYLILKNILAIAKEAKDEFGALLCVGTVSLYFLHTFINIGMTMGILPVVGLPLIFLSYGGTHIFINFLLLGVVFNVSKQ